MTVGVLDVPMTRRSAPTNPGDAAKKTSLKVSQDFLRMLNAVCNFLGVEQGVYVETDLKQFIRERYEKLIRKEADRLHGQ